MVYSENVKALENLDDSDPDICTRDDSDFFDDDDDDPFLSQDGENESDEDNDDFTKPLFIERNNANSLSQFLAQQIAKSVNYDESIGKGQIESLTRFANSTYYTTAFYSLVTFVLSIGVTILKDHLFIWTAVDCYGGFAEIRLSILDGVKS
ncbi:331_t:CDS:2 [Acaulospora colombiana]|uniref:331_t:CDS:1 n=1 Tax=Acaulospora colombiana TaxID=27376 RepID=A0ACA9M2H5_9GLOM|nr:331_t:CDS:2 [Acaulospora colombiana]